MLWITQGLVTGGTACPHIQDKIRIIILGISVFNVSYLNTVCFCKQPHIIIMNFLQQLEQSQPSDNLKQYWMPDEQCKVCYECGVRFHTFRRKHHCRLCGQIFCNRCCNEELSGYQIGYTGK